MLPTLSLKALTWIRDNHGLFDYETLELNKNTLEMRGSSRLVRCGYNVGTEGEVDASSGEQIEPLANVQLLDGTVRGKHRPLPRIGLLQEAGVRRTARQTVAYNQ
eukprot:TRINITY_DN6402_c0_g1_i8.p3 TRINITY_DN6402_c0_g1~~TRINITY_DN6402_c0_g1_i8.p3  ORF type:complete len:105 (+),score=8.15 TRINITY_DN6402_c0_g1_i8:178-492(+)